MSRAEYMRAYRARKKATMSWDEIARAAILGEPYVAAKRIAELEAEVKHLKRDLAKANGTLAEIYQARVAAQLAKQEAAPAGRSASDNAARGLDRTGAAGGFNTRPFTPVPRTKGK